MLRKSSRKETVLGFDTAENLILEQQLITTILYVVDIQICFEKEKRISKKALKMGQLKNE